jgi:hypothetical protein
MSNSVVCGSENSQFSDSANFLIVVIVARCSVLTGDLKKKKNMEQVMMKLMNIYTMSAGGIVFKDIIAHRENIRVAYKVYFIMEINRTTLNFHV